MSSKITHVTECGRPTEFRKFLRDLNNDGGCSGTGVGVEMRNCVARSNNDTYPVSADEYEAEVIMATWNHIQAIRCPRPFQIQLLRAGIAEVEKECRSAKECDFTYAGNKQLEEPVEEFHYDLVKLQKFVVNNLEKLITRLDVDAEEDNPKHYDEYNLLCNNEKCHCFTSAIIETTTMNSTMTTLTNITKPLHVSAIIKNKPRKMEDRHVCLERFSEMYQLKQSYSFYGVFDGHSGTLAASYAVNQLPYLLAKQLKVTQTNEIDIREAFESSFLQTDRMFARKRISSGTTAVCALLTHTNPNHLYIAWVGDSKALLVGIKASLQLVKPHKPDLMDERKRIECNETGGAVMFVQGQWRVNGILNVSRSIGDFSVSAVIAEPDIVDVEITAEHDFLVLATDGLWDHVAEQQVIDAIYTALAIAEQKVEDIPKILIDLAKKGDSQDNITVVIVFLKERQKIVECYKKN
ncbi:protein phosphatase 1F [Teleopsis dalmanni]|uniref:protein phosphatase 1F n=1 Tax=Teleopsis dalmanni TaxID=139649 RepID=UPI0018CCF192|nr:protein phosphatase 1F [Teleopsis dalmanni]